jgi:cell wall-associated NlpC family hydrolase
MHLTVLSPETKTTDLYGREYEFGVTDCFDAMRDYLETQNIKILPRVMFIEDFWDKNIDYFTEETIKNWNHYPVELNNIQKNDVLIFKIFSEINNHCGVYLGNDIFYHHAENRLSCRENLYPRWHKWLTGAYRYGT